MIGGLELLAGGLLQLAAAGVKCSAAPVPHVQAAPRTAVVQYDYSKSHAALGDLDIDTVSPYGPDHPAKVGGLMSGEIRVQTRMEVMQDRFPARGAGCVHINKVDITLHVSPTIYIAREFPKGTCRHAAIVEHEKKHVQTDMAVAQKYAGIIERKLSARLKQNGYSFGPYPLEKIQDVQKSLQESLIAAVNEQIETMSQERHRLQQELDSLAEYERVSAMCKGRENAPASPGHPGGNWNR